MCDKFKNHPRRNKIKYKTEHKKIYLGHGNYLLVNHVRSDWLGVCRIDFVLSFHVTADHPPPPRFIGSLDSACVIEIILLNYVSKLLLGTPTARESRRGKQLITCPGFPGYCSESYVGDTCTVVCDRGRNNVPQCQEDGTWTDVPRCIEHEPGIEEQVTGICPGVPGYCSLDLPGALCEFACPLGAPIRYDFQYNLIRFKM